MRALVCAVVKKGDTFSWHIGKFQGGFLALSNFKDKFSV